MIEFFNANPESFWFALGFLLLATEALVLGLSTGVVLFAGFGALITGGLIYFGVIPGTLVWSIGTFGLGSAAITALCWKPLKALQGKSGNMAQDTSSDFIGLQFRLDSAISNTQPGTTRYSGVEWKVEIDHQSSSDSLEAGDLVKVTSLEAGLFRVCKAGE